MRCFKYQPFLWQILTEVITQPLFITQKSLCTRFLEEDYIYEPKLETTQHDTLPCATIITSLCLCKGEEVMSPQLTLNFGSNRNESDLESFYRAVLNHNSSVVKPIRVLINFDQFAFTSFKHVRIKRSLENHFNQLKLYFRSAQQVELDHLLNQLRGFNL